MSSNAALNIKGAKENNLKDISLEIPHDKLTVVTGLSGSGKSSLAFHTAYAEGQRRYIETFSSYTRQFLDKVKKPDADLIENVRPAIAIQQRTRVTNSRSTVGTMTGVNDYLKLIWSNLARPACPNCGIEVKKWQARDLCQHFKKIAENNPQARFLIAAPIKISDKKKLAEEVERFITLGFSRYFNPKTATFESFEESDSFELTYDNRLILILDRFQGKSFKEKRTKDSIDQAFAASNGICLLINSDTSPKEFKAEYKKLKSSPCAERKIPSPPVVLEFRNSFSCSMDNWSLARPRSSLFTFNHPMGACPTCRGFGKILEIDPEKCVPNPRLSIDEGALHCWQIARARPAKKKLAAFCQSEGIATDIPWNKLKTSQKDLIFNHKSKAFTGVKHWFKRLEPKKYKMHIRVFLSRYKGQFKCPDCNSARLKPGALAYKIASLKLPDIWQMPIRDAYKWLSDLQDSSKNSIAYSRDLNEAFKAAISRLKYLIDLGLPYLSLDREARTLSGGETQRVNIAGAIGSDLVSTSFVLDEPSVGLHPKDSSRMLDAIRGLQLKGNTVLVVEHDPECIEAADHIIELGPEAGDQGGKIVYQGSAKKWKGLPLKIEKPKISKLKPKKFLKVKNASSRNIKNLNLDIPLENFVCLTGVSGSGKSTLVSQIIFKAYEQFKNSSPKKALVSGFQHVDQLMIVDQSSLAKSPRANLATYSKIWDTVRTMLANTDEAEERALGKSAFSFNVEGGRCPECKGAGHIKEDMQFLSDIYIQCDLCLGKRFQEAVLEVKYKGKNVDDFLNMSVSSALKFFEDIKQIKEACTILETLGLGHLRLGHPLSELSGGEAQRLKLVPFLQKSSKGTSLLIFDEPTTGLHVRDVERLITLFQILKERGHSVLCIEHNLQLVAECDWIIDLGPEGGSDGGEIVLEGEPASFLTAAASKKSHTARYLKEFVDRYSKKKKSSSTKITKFPKANPAHLHVQGAREHNLKNIDVKIPLGSVVALTGVSGSGKSSIAKDIVYAEGQRRYLDCLSPYARQFIKELKKPDIDSIENIPPTICVYQHTFQPSRLSTIGTMSEVYNFMRLLYSKIGTQYCPDHPDKEITPLSAEEIAADIKNFGKKAIRILAPIIKNKKGLHKEVFQRAINADINEVRIDGMLDAPSKYLEGLQRSKTHTIEYTIARFTPANMDQELITEAVQYALSLSGGTISVLTDKDEWIYSRDRTCPSCKQGFFKPDPEDLSFNSRRGACDLCSGSGFFKDEICSACEGTRINEIGRNIRIKDFNIAEASYLTPLELKKHFAKVNFDARNTSVAEPILKEINAKLDSLVQLGLDYLPLDRDCSTLSSGELQRLRLGAAVGSPLTGVMYIFDEPSAGLHPLDNRKVLAELRSLNDRGNSVIIIEHDEESILACDDIIDIGPGGGRDGGEIVYSGPLNKFLSNQDSQTAKALRGELNLKTFVNQSKFDKFLHVKNASCNNIESLNTKIPLHALNVVCGVSGAGKSSLVHGIIADTVNLSKKSSKESWSFEKTSIKSDEKIESFFEIDQTPIGANSRSTPASYLKIWDNIRKLYANTIEAKSRGWDASYFSYNTGKGKCPECQGKGELKLEMSFLADAHIPCETCNTGRYNDDANSIRYLDLSISEVLDLTFEEAKSHFANHGKVHRALHQACELGLGYLSLGQSSATLSGGESQRIKLVAELSKKRKGHTVYVLDEPTTGLHKADVQKLIKILHTLKEQGHSIIIIEHDPDVIKAADHIIEMGPGPAEEGGKIIFQGTPKELLKAKSPWAKELSKQKFKRSAA